MKSDGAYLYFGGGPGWSSLPDQSMMAQALGRAGIDMRFWNEPSPLRPDGHTFFTERAFHNWMYSASQFLNETLAKFSRRGVVTHGFSTLPLLKMIEAQNIKLDQFVAVSPYLDCYAYQKRLVNLSIQDFLRLKDIPVAGQLKQLYRQTKQISDEPIQQALQISLHNPCLFDHFWHDLNKRDVWFDYMSEKESQLDLVSWQAVYSDYGSVMEHLNFERKMDIPCLAVIGERDPIVKKDKVLEELSKVFENVEVKVLPRCSHLPQLECPEEFAQLLSFGQPQVHLEVG